MNKPILFFAVCLLFIPKIAVAEYLSLNQWRLAAEGGNPKAQFILGTRYRTGQGVAQNYGEAFNWYRFAGEQGHLKAQMGLGYMYSNGLGVLQNHEEALNWYRKAAKQGSAPAQLILGSMYLKGQGTNQDDAVGYMWTTLAAWNGLYAAYQARDDIAVTLSPESILRAEKNAKTCLASEYRTCD